MQQVTEFEPLGDRILIEPDGAKDKTESGLYIPDMAKDRPQQGTVVKVGPGKYDPQTQSLIPMRVEVGDRVMYAKFSGTDIRLDDVPYLITTEQDIFGIIKVRREDEKLKAFNGGADNEAVSVG